MSPTLQLERLLPDLEALARRRDDVRERAGLRTRLLLLRALLRSRPWRLFASGSAVEQRLRGELLRRWLKADAEGADWLPPASLSRVEHTLTTALGELHRRESQDAVTGEASPALPALLGSALGHLGLLDEDELIGALDLLHAGSGEDPALVALLADLGVLRPSGVRAGAAFAATLLRSALAPDAEAKLARLEALGALQRRRGVDDAEEWHQVPWALRLALASPEPLEEPQTLAPGLALWPPRQVLDPSVAELAWPQAKPSPMTLLVGGGFADARAIVGWLAPSARVWVLDAHVRGARLEPWLALARRLRPGPLLVIGNAPSLPADLFTAEAAAAGPCFVQCPARDLDLVRRRTNAPALELDGGDLWVHGVAVRLAARGDSSASLWNEGLIEVTHPLTRVAQLGALLSPQRERRERVQALLGDIGRARMDFDGLRRLARPAAPLVLAKATAEVLGEAKKTVAVCGAARRGERPRGELASRVVIVLEGERSVVQRLAAFEIGLAWGQPLYEIDISFVLSRYIGEAEERLAEIFERARATGCGLYLEEAQGMLGKRTELKRSTDRYSAMQVQYVAQALDEFDGLFVMSTSASGSLDQSIASRALFRIHFAELHPRERARFLRESFPTQAPLGDDIDWEILAEDFVMDPDQCQRVGMQAAIEAARRAERDGGEALIDHDALVRAATTVVARK